MTSGTISVGSLATRNYSAWREMLARKRLVDEHNARHFDLDINERPPEIDFLLERAARKSAIMVNVNQGLRA